MSWQQMDQTIALSNLKMRLAALAPSSGKFGRKKPLVAIKTGMHASTSQSGHSSVPAEGIAPSLFTGSCLCSLTCFWNGAMDVLLYDGLLRCNPPRGRKADCTSLSKCLRGGPRD